jgi:pSer/pThr/pTyr-binding forkhead associated (FHA) protein
MVTCARCGRENPEDARFCSNCGAPLATATAGSSSTSLQESHDSTSTIALPAEGGNDEVMEALDSEAQATVEGLLPDTALLVVMRGPSAGSRFLLDADVTKVGRHPDGDIFLDDVTVSRRHAEFVREADGFHVRDVGSLNGTYVNRQRIDDVLLAGGDEVQIGKFRLVFLSGPRGGEA